MKPIMYQLGFFDSHMNFKACYKAESMSKLMIEAERLKKINPRIRYYVFFKA